MPNDEASGTPTRSDPESSPSVSATAKIWGDARLYGGRAAQIKEINILIVLLILSTFLTFSTEFFFTQDNLLGVGRAFSMTAIVAIGQTMVIITGGIDLSVGSVWAFSGITTALLMQEGWPLELAMPGGFVAGMTFGLFNGLLITKIGLPPFIATLGTLSIGRGLIYVLTESRPVTIDRDEAGFLVSLGQGYVGPVPVPLIIMIGVAILAMLFLSQTTLGRYIYAVGGNEEAARLAGINVTVVKVSVYMLCSMLASLSGMILVARLVSAQPASGIGFELPVIAAAIIGGTSLLGGEGTVLGAVLGAAIIGVLENGIVHLGINTYYTQIVIGSVVLLAVSLDMWQKRRALAV